VGRSALQARARELRAEGVGPAAIARQLGVSDTTVHRWTNEAYAERNRVAARERKRQARGVCSVCGGETRYHGHGRRVSDVCAGCSRAQQHTERKWTPEAVIDAIRRFTAANGRPPKAAEWINADPVNGYPARSAVYRSKSWPGAPFASWADAIEAAGFPRPRVGYYERTPETRARAAEGQRRRQARQRLERERAA
jgi:hypothetical protein